MKSKKRVFFVNSLLYFIISTILYINFVDIEIPGWVNIIAIIAIIISFWYLLTRIFDKKYIFHKMVFLELFVVGNLLFLQWFPTLGTVAQMAFILITTILIYILQLAINVYYVSEKQEEYLPLLQPAQVFVFMSLILNTFVWSVALYKIPYFSILKESENQILIQFFIILLFFIYYIVLFKSLWWFLDDRKVGELTEDIVSKRKSAIIFGALSLWQVSTALMLFPFETFGRSLLVGVTAYVVVNILSKYLTHKLNKSVYIKSFFVLIIAYMLVYII